MDKSIERGPAHVADDDSALAVNVRALDVDAIDNKVLKRAVTRVKESLDVKPHSAYYTKHGSHKRYSKGW